MTRGEYGNKLHLELLFSYIMYRGCDNKTMSRHGKMNILNYKGYEGTAEIDMESRICRGKILFINDLVTYQSSTPAGLQEAFEAAVDDYLETCEHLAREPRKPLKGVFNVRISPDLHKLAAIRALEEGVSLNKVVVKSMDSYLSEQREHV